MVANVRELWFEDFSGGVNDRLPPSSIGEDQAVNITNMLVNYGGYKLKTRPGFSYVSSVSPKVSASNTLLSVFPIRLAGGTERVYTAEKTTTGSIIIRQHNGVAWSTLYTITGATLAEGVWFCGWDSDRVFFSDDLTGLYTFIASASTPTVTKVRDMQQSGTVYAPYGRNLVQHKGRLWLSHGAGLFFCGTDDLSGNRWENWSPVQPSAADPLASVIDDGGDMGITPFGTNITGLCSTANGLIIFKDSSISMLSYPDSAAPWEVEQGASIITITESSGGIANSISELNGGAVFLSRDSRGDVHANILNGSEIVDISVDIPNRMSMFRYSSTVYAEAVGQYFLVGDESGVRYVYDTQNNCWTDFDTPNFTACSHGMYDRRIVFCGSNGLIYQYPSLNPYDDGDSEITFMVETREFRPAGAARDAKARKLWCEVGGDSQANITYSLTVNGVSGILDSYGTWDKSTSGDVWDTAGDNWDDGDLWDGQSGVHLESVDVNVRGKIMQIKASGSAVGDTYIDRLGIGFRRKQGRD